MTGIFSTIPHHKIDPLNLKGLSAYLGSNYCDYAVIGERKMKIDSLVAQAYID